MRLTGSVSGFERRGKSLILFFLFLKVWRFILQRGSERYLVFPFLVHAGNRERQETGISRQGAGICSPRRSWNGFCTLPSVEGLASVGFGLSSMWVFFGCCPEWPFQARAKEGRHSLYIARFRIVRLGPVRRSGCPAGRWRTRMVYRDFISNDNLIRLLSAGQSRTFISG